MIVRAPLINQYQVVHVRFKDGTRQMAVYVSGRRKVPRVCTKGKDDTRLGSFLNAESANASPWDQKRGIPRLCINGRRGPQLPSEKE